MSKPTHMMKDGEYILIEDMDDNHLKNTLRMYERKAEEGVVRMYGGGGMFEEPWYDEEELRGDEALDAFNYADYFDEAVKRGIGGFPKYRPLNRSIGTFTLNEE